MHTVSLFYILMGLLFVPNGMLRGAGDMAAFTFSSMANLFSRVGIAYALVYLTPLGANAIWWSIPAGWLIGAAVSCSGSRVESGCARLWPTADPAGGLFQESQVLWI
ncbi:MAG: hypothetical protein ACLTYN_05185 [Dysosmobacter welbionis]